jgi:hypothetical protein
MGIEPLVEARRLVGNWLAPGHNGPGYYESLPASYELRQAIRKLLEATRTPEAAQVEMLREALEHCRDRFVRDGTSTFVVDGVLAKIGGNS